MKLKDILKAGDTIYHPKYGYVELKARYSGEYLILTEDKNRVWIIKEDMYVSEDHYKNHIMYLENFSKSKLKDKDLVWCRKACTKSTNSAAFELRFYDAKNKCVFFEDGDRNGPAFSYMEKFEGEYPEWVEEARKMLED